MSLFNSLLSAAVLAISVLTAQTNATPLVSNGLSARHVGISANHHGHLHKRVSHRQRKRCLAQNAPGASTSSSSSAAPAASANSNGGGGGNNNNGGNNNGGNNNNGGVTYTPPVGGNVCGGGKVGLAAEYNVDASRYVTPHTCIYYNWDASDRGPYDIPGITYVPMVSREGNIGNFYANVVNRPERNFPWVAFFNEADQGGQSNLGVDYALQLWRQHALPLRARGIKLLSPSVTSSPDGTNWIQKFYDSLGDGEKPDAIALHWYGTDFDSLKNYINDMSGRFGGRHIWLTEFGCTLFPSIPCSIDQVAFAAQAVSFLNGHWAVDIWAPFGLVNDLGGANEGVRMMDPGSGQLTAVGSTYLWS